MGTETGAGMGAGKRLGKLSVVPVLILILVFLSGMQAVAASGQPRLSQTGMTLYVGQTFRLKISGTGGKKVTWSASGKNVVSITAAGDRAAVIRAEKAGKAVITARVGKAKVSCTVKVPKPSYSLKLKKKSVTMYEGRTQTVRIKASARRSVLPVEVVSDNEEIAVAKASKKKILITGRNFGTTWIRVRYGNKAAKIRVEVKEPRGKYQLNLDVADPLELACEVTAAGSTKQHVFDVTALINGIPYAGYSGRSMPAIQLTRLSGPVGENLPEPQAALDLHGGVKLVVSVPDYKTMRQAFLTLGGPVTCRYRISLMIGADLLDRDLTITIKDKDPSYGENPVVQNFLASLYEMDAIVRDDIAHGRNWEYHNSSRYPRPKTFEEAISTNVRWTNCVDAVQWGLLRSGAVPGRECIQWYGSRGVVWVGSGAKAAALAYMDLIDVGNKTVRQCINDGTLQPGDIITYRSFAHTNVYLGNELSFDSGHANCTSGGEGALFARWISPVTYEGRTIAQILRLK